MKKNIQVEAQKYIKNKVILVTLKKDKNRDKFFCSCKGSNLNCFSCGGSGFVGYKIL